MPRSKRLMAAVLAATASAVCGGALAHDFWINHGRYVGPDGVHCCGPNDCVEVPDTQVSISSQGYSLLGYGEVVPYREVQVSQDGKYWRCRKRDGSRRCFFAPPPGV